jgi:DNA repair protein RadC
MGQPDREQFCVLMLNAKNFIIGMNIVSTSAVCHLHLFSHEMY